MAIAFVKNGGAAGDKAGLTVLSATVPAGGHALGNLVVVATGWGATTGIGRTAVISDSRSNSYTAIETGSPGSAIGQQAPIAASVLTTALQAGDTITVTVSGGALTRLALASVEFSGASLTEDVASAAASGTVGQPTVGPITPPSAATLVLSALMLGGPTSDTFTQDSDSAGGDTWHAGPIGGTSGGSATGNITLRPAYKITTSSVAQTYNPTVGTVRNWAATIVALQAVVTTPGPSQMYRFVRANRFLTSR